MAQGRLQNALEEKVVLLKEIHHRVKNNLQIVASLLNLQLHSIRDPADVDLFRMSQNRVYSMSLTHELLYQAADLSSVEMAEYGHRLISYLRDSETQASARVVSEFGHFVLSLDQAMPCGLILNELVTNAIKYGRCEGEESTIKVLMRVYSKKGQGREVRVVVEDRGPGLPPGLDPQHSTGLGLSLVISLTKQLGGEVEWGGLEEGSEHSGTRVVMTFPFDTVEEGIVMAASP
jgi:two-component system, sensor histidine kinase PdtaS